MQALSSTLRSQLERTVIAARDVAEEGAWAALERLAVNKAGNLPPMSAEQRDLRVKLRARARQLGDVRHKNGEQDIYYLHRECAYEVWHQMLFARFLTENNLLIHPEMHVPVTLEECEELAADEGTDGWTLAARYASRMLPQIFRPDDPLLGVTYAPEDKQAVEQLLADLPVEVFTADDSLGWVYQFWQTKRKKEINDSGEKIGADELPAVTQLFTEDYMVKFLLHNTLGAWWAGKKLTAEDVQSAESEEELRAKVALPGVEWEYLRFVRGEDGKSGPWRPAAGTFDGWPKQAAELKIMDPCCGSGHFLVAAFDLMVRIRMDEEGLGAAEASDAVLRDNLFGVEIDPRCTQIAAFALAFAAWAFPDTSGYRELPELHIACSGIAPQATEDQWVKLAEQSGIPVPPGGREPIRNGLINLHRLFLQAPTLGSLIDPNELPGDLIAADYQTLQPHVAAALAGERLDEEMHERAVAAAGMVKATDLLAGEYTLVVTNVPYLGRKNQCEKLRDWADKYQRDAKQDLATMFLGRALRWLSRNGTLGVVTPQNWLFLTNYRKLRTRLLNAYSWNALARLGEHAFESSAAAGAFAAITILSHTPSPHDQRFWDIDVSPVRGQPPVYAEEKAARLRGKVPTPARILVQAQQLKNPKAAIGSGFSEGQKLLSDYAVSVQGFGTSDNSPFIRCYWELPQVSGGWVWSQSACDRTSTYAGRQNILLWEGGSGRYLEHALRLKAAGRLGGWKSGGEAWNKRGVSIAEMREMHGTIFTGEMFDNTAHVIVPHDPEHLLPIWTFFSSGELVARLRKAHRGLKVSNNAVLDVPFDLAHWQKVAAEKYPDGLPEPETDDPTQWLFHGRPEESTAPMQVAVAWLLGYRWPAQLDEKMRLSERARGLVKRCDELLPFADADGIVCIPAVGGERTAADRLLALFSASGVKPAENLDDWLRDELFQEHCQLFHQRPFVWHIWDGRRKDGFHALVNYHRLDRRLLEKLIYRHLDDWIARQKGAESRGESGAEARRLAAEDLQQRLKLILAGEPPYDIFVRWKPLEEQPIGWDPDLNDGVRVNIRPFVAAGVLRKDPKVNWKKDRGKEPERPKEQYPWFWSWDEETVDFMGGSTFDGNRWNDCHYSNEVKQAARTAAQGAKRG